jgi:hypothetical protein
MPEELKTSKPQMYGITPPQMEIPAGRLSRSNWRQKKRPWLITLFILNNFVHSAFYLALALVPWSDPDSDLATTLIAHPNVIFAVLPKFIQPSMAIEGAGLNRVLTGLPIIFLVLAVLFGVAGWKLYDQDPWWYFMVRWGMMCNSGYIVVKFMLALSSDFVVTGGPELIPTAAMTYLIPVIGWNLLIFCYFAMMPDVVKAYDS